MLTRLLLTLTLVLQPLAVRAVVQPSSTPHPARCAAGSCCEIVESVSCCGERVVEHRCHRTGGECRCAVEPSDPEPRPSAPLPRDGREAPMVLDDASAVVVEIPRAAPSRACVAVPVRHSSHNETQALLCVWRT